MFLSGAVAGLTVAVVVLTALALRLHEANRCLREDLGQYKQLFQIRSGYQHDVGNYYLLSFDGGEHWHEMERHEDGSLGYIREASLELIEKLDAMTAFLNRLHNRGSVDFADPAQLSALNSIGLTVARRDES